MSLLDKIKKNSTIKETALIKESKILNEKENFSLPVIGMNIAFAGDLEEGAGPGLTVFAGPSRHFKSLFTLITCKAYMDKYPDAVLLFYDCEFGTPISYFESLDFDMERVIYTPITNMEDFKFDIMQQLNGVDRKDHLIIAMDSYGNLASKKEVDDAEAGKSTADMTRAKQGKSIWRMVTPHLTMKNIPMIIVNHVYSTMDLFPKDIMSGGTGVFLAADNIFFIGRRQEKDGSELEGYNFVMKVEKSRHSREGSKIPITVKFEGGINKYSGLMDIALEGNFAAKPKNGWYTRVDQETGELEEKNWRLKDTNCKEFWDPILSSQKFKDYIKLNFKVSDNKLLEQEEE